MDGENNGKPYEKMDDLGIPLFLETCILAKPSNWKLKLPQGETTIFGNTHIYIKSKKR